MSRSAPKKSEYITDVRQADNKAKYICGNVRRLKTPLATIMDCLVSNSAADQPSDTQQHIVFVYGTLKYDQPNRRSLESVVGGQMRVLSKEASLTSRYPMVRATRLDIPFLLDKCGTGEVRQITFSHN